MTLQNTIQSILEDRETPSPYPTLLSEEMHEKLQNILNSEVDPRRKLNILTGTVRQLIKNGENTGLESDKPKKGSSRAVYFPKEEKHIKIDGVETSSPSVVKVAFPGTLDPHTEDESLLGEHQNRIESCNWLNHHYGVLKQIDSHHSYVDKPKEFAYNENGILPPHFGHHEDNHWLEMGRVSKLNSKDFKEATKTPDFPKGITHNDFYAAVNQNWDEAHGVRSSHKVPNEIQDHPLVSTASEFCGNSDVHPVDFVKRNLGIWQHPVTGKKHVVLADFGLSRDVSNLYVKARRNMMKKYRGY